MKATPASSSNRLLLWMGAGIGVLVFIAALVAILRQPTEFEAGTPEAATQQYVQAVIDDEPEAAWALLTPALQSSCTAEELDDRSHRSRGRILLVDTETRDDSATVDLRITTTYSDDPFAFDEQSYERQFRLSLVDGEWRISDAPWPFYRCQ